LDRVDTIAVHGDLSSKFGSWKRAECSTPVYGSRRRASIPSEVSGHRLPVAAQRAALPSPVMGQEREESQGFYEMLWDCQFCDTRGLLAKSQRFCANCG